MRTYPKFLLFIIFISACKENKNEDKKYTIENTKKTENQNLVLNKLNKLNENIDLIGGIQSFSIIDNQYFAISTSNSKSVFIYDFEGNQIHHIKSGVGPEQFNNPSILKSYKSILYIWDSNNLEIHVYNKSGEFIEKYSGFETGIRDFALLGDNIALLSGGGNNYIFSVHTKEGILINTFGQPSNEDIILSLNQCSGGIAVNNDKLFIVSPSILKLISFDTEKNEVIEKKTIIDPDFTVNTAPLAIDFINNHRSAAIDYLLNNSNVSGLYHTKDHIFIIANTGNIDYEKGNNNPFSNRFMKLYVLDMNFKIISIKKGQAFIESNCLFSTYEENLYMLTFDHENEGFNLNRVEY